MSFYENAVRLQEKLARKVTTKDTIKIVRKACGVDVSYKDKCASAAAVVMDTKNFEILDYVISKTEVRTPYVPGLMMLREADPVLSALKSLKEKFDILLVDGNGMLHPRKCGLASYLGIVLNKPTIGVAKSLLCGKIEGNAVKLDGKILGKIIEKKKGRKIFVSVGNKISLKTAVKLAESLIKEEQWLPQPLLVADKLSKGHLPRLFSK
jgi:deoxyribonuclease V